MQSLRFPLLPMAALALLLSPCLTACGMRERVRIQTFSEERSQQVPKPAIPPATTPCSFASTRLCNSDAETGQVLKDYDGSLAEANRRLEWLDNWRLGLQAKPKRHR